jgi:hypothetical protein
MAIGKLQVRVFLEHLHPQPCSFPLPTSLFFLLYSGNVVFPDTIVAVGQPDIPGDPYRWALEFQCVQTFDHALFVGINYYSRSAVGAGASRNLKEMLDASYKYGIDNYWNKTSASIRFINHEGCIY